jgi:hypothetical protein
VVRGADLADFFQFDPSAAAEMFPPTRRG